MATVPVAFGAGYAMLPVSVGLFAPVVLVVEMTPVARGAGVAMLPVSVGLFAVVAVVDTLPAVVGAG